MHGDVSLASTFRCGRLPRRTGISYDTRRAKLYNGAMALGTRILIVDDDADIRDGLSEFLSDEGFEVATASNGQVAMEWLRVHRPKSCVILLDLMMPLMDGWAFLRAKQSEPDLAALAVVIITAGPTEFDETPDIRGCLNKPIDLPSLLNAIASCSPADIPGIGAGHSSFWDGRN